MHLIRQSTESTVTVGPVLDSTGATVTSAVVGDFRISKNGTTATLSGATVTHDANGYYNIALTTGNTDTAGRLVLFSGNTAQSMGAHRFTVLLPSVFDALITNATNSTGGLATATAAISAFAGAISTFAGGAVASVTGRVTANVDQWNGVAVTGMPMPTYTQPTGFLAATFPTTVASPTNIIAASGVVLAAQTHTGAVIPTVTAVTNAVVLPSSATINITGNINGNVTGSVGSVTGNVGGNVSGSVGSIAGVTFPSNFASLSVDLSGRVLLQPTQTGVTIPTVTSLTNSVTVGGYAAGQAPLQPTVAGRTLDVTATGAAGIDLGNVENQNAALNLTQTIVNQVNEVVGPVGEISGVTFPTHFSNLVIAANGHVTATVDSINNNAITASSIQANALTAAKFAADSITASALATDAVNEVRDAVAAITPIADLATMIINDGTANARYSVSALQNGPSGAGGSTINVYPVSASTPERVAGTTITYYRDENRAVSVVTDFVLDALTLEFVVEDSEGTDLLVIPDGSISKSNKTFTVTIGTTVTTTISNYRWSVRDITNGSNSVIARGVLSVQEAASNG